MSSQDMGGMRRVHRLTPLLRFWSVILALATLIILNFQLSVVADIAAYLRGGHWRDVGFGSLLTLAGFVVTCAVVWFLSYYWWQKLGYQVGEEEISLRHGLISTSFRSARYDRVQAVDVVESIIARLFGLAAVRVETAGGTASVIVIQYLPKAQAVALREEILGHVHGRQAPQSDEGTLSQQPLAEEGQLVARIPLSRSLAATALRVPTILTGAILTALWIFVPDSKASLIPLVVGVVPSLWNLIDSSTNFTARQEGEVLHVSYGLADKRKQAMRLERIHAVRVSQPFLWRLCGWYEVNVSVAGYGTKGGGKQSGTTRIMPVGSRQQALDMLELCSDLNAQDIEAYARPEGFSQPTYTSPRRAWVASPVDFSRQAITLVGDVVIGHIGRFNRRVSVVSAPHIQELTYKSGPLAQLARVGDVLCDLVPGPVGLGGYDLAPADARALLERLRRRRLPAMEGNFGTLDSAGEA